MGAVRWVDDSTTVEDRCELRSINGDLQAAPSMMTITLDGFD